ncbi:hypothetical protein FHX37_0080 [Haloactinospora alba]|uniref:Secreted protein n=1 Tax=Haloactinospora alba TaxID=405555 RepID=A0A543NEJ6_9ACTN|nr:hypothetical protein [Haloactinospora alba]TQN30219.1 hypothetical protein FHX37_0080 [Haloactinospora alba]
MRAISRVIAVAGATALACSLAPAAAADDTAPDPQVVKKETEADTTTLTYDNGSTFTSIAPLDGSFNWTAEFDVGIYSRTYSTPNNGTHEVQVDSITNCDPAHGTAYIRLERDQLIGWSSEGTQTIDCDGGTATFTGIDSGTFRWYMRVHGDSSGSEFGRDASGTTTYP